MKIRLASNITYDSIVDGPGIRCVLWTQGCPHKCKGCHNPQTHSMNDGQIINADTVINELKQIELHKGLTISGGEPFLQTKSLIYIIENIKKEKDWDIWCYTGYLFEDLIKNKDCSDLLNKIDVLVDGKFIENQKDYKLKFKGSSNQRIIDVQKSLKENEIVLYK